MFLIGGAGIEPAFKQFIRVLLTTSETSARDGEQLSRAGISVGSGSEFIDEITIV